jgi:hypothetical protein
MWSTYTTSWSIENRIRYVLATTVQELADLDRGLAAPRA